MVDLKIVEGVVGNEAELKTMEAKATLLNDDATRLQLMTARLLKAMGKKVKTRVSLGALACCVGKVFTVIPQQNHGEALSQFINLVAFAIQNEYTPEQMEQARQMALDAQKLKETQGAEAGQPS